MLVLLVGLLGLLARVHSAPLLYVLVLARSAGASAYEAAPCGGATQGDGEVCCWPR